MAKEASVHKKANMLRSTFTALFAALICVGCFISIPLPGGVPITVQNLFAVLAGLILGPLQGAGAVGLFLILGGLGIPVFSGVVGGIAILIGPTGGFLWGYFIAALVAGFIVGTPSVREKQFSVKQWIRIAIASLVGFALIYVPGVPWFRHIVLSNPENSLHTVIKGLSVGEQFKKVLGWTVTPFIAGDIIKIVISVPLAAIIRPVAAKYLYPNDEKEAQELVETLSKKRR